MTGKLGRAFQRAFPEQRLFLRSEGETRFLRLSPATQFFALTGSTLIIGWSIIASALVLINFLGTGNVRDQAMREQSLYEERLNDLSAERDASGDAAQAAMFRFNTALDQVSAMQSALLAAENRNSELETGLNAVHATLLRAIAERDIARAENAELAALAGTSPDADARATRAADVAATLELVTQALGDTAAQRDALFDDIARAGARNDALQLEQQLQHERNQRIFAQLEDALTISVEPLDKMFASAGLSTETLLDAVRAGYSGQGGPLTPLIFSTKGEEAPDADGLRANSILERLDRMNLYRIAAEKAPFSLPIHTAFRFTSGFGPRWGRMHYGTDFAASYGTPVYATADGVVIKAGWSTGYGRLIKIQHEFGIETRYAHLSKIRVNVGQRVSRGDRIGDMGNSGHSTGTHLHYEVRVGGTAVNPMTYIRAAQDVF